MEKRHHRSLWMGASYYPERFPKEEWSKDARNMRQAGFRFIRTGEFAWSKFEPECGRFDFSWMDEALDVFAASGLKVILCTPTASPMPWITAKHPDSVPVTADGKPFVPGERRHYCFNNRDFRQYACRMCREMAEHYRGHPAVMGWQIDNELGGEEFVCHCGFCRTSFQEWLQAKYGSLEELNRRWGGTFFSLEFLNWNEIPVPLSHNVRFFNPTFRKDYFAFYSDSMKDFLLSQYEILKNAAGDVPVTTNRFTLFWSDQFDHGMDADLDVVSFDNYDLNLSLAGYHHDFYRGIKKDVPYWVLEQHTGFREFGIPPAHAGLQAVQSFARGSELVCGFSWRQVQYGVEQDLHGVVDYDGTPGETYGMFADLNRWLDGEGAAMADLSLIRDIGIVHSHESSLTYRTINMGIDYHKALYEEVYTPLFELGLGVEFLFGEKDWDQLSAYKMVLVPLAIVKHEGMLAALAEYAKQGGIVVITGDFMQKNEDNWRIYGDDRAGLADCLGLEWGLWHAVPESNRVVVEGEAEEGITGCYEMGGFFQKFRPLDNPDVHILARVTHPSVERGVPAIAERRIGAGSLLFTAGMPKKELVKALVRRSMERIGVETVELPEQAELIRLWNKDAEPAAYVLINKSASPLSLRVRGLSAPLEVNPDRFLFKKADC